MFQYRVFAVSVFFLLSFFANANLVQAQAQRPWTVKSVSGDARLSVDGGAASELRQGSLIGVGSKVTTGARARVVLARGTELMMMSPRSEIAIPAETGSMLTRIIQNLGTLLLKVEKRPEQHFEIKTPYLAAVVKGTSFTVSVDQSGSAVHVVSGLVQVNDLISGQSGLVKPGRTGVVTSRPGGGLKISGGRSNRGTKLAKAKVEKKKFEKDDANTNQAAKSEQKAKNKTRKQKARNQTRKRKARNQARKRKARNLKFSVGKATRSGAVRNVALKRGKDSKGPAIVTVLGIAKIDISAVTNGFIQADVGSGRNAAPALGEDEKSVNAEVAESNDSVKVGKPKRRKVGKFKRGKVGKSRRGKVGKSRRGKVGKPKRRKVGKSRRGKVGKSRRG